MTDNLKERAFLVLSGMLGAILAVLSDLIQKNEAAATLKIAYTIQTTLAIAFSNLMAAILLVMLGAALCLVFEAKTKKSAFYVGASILTIIMTVTPYESPPSLNSHLPNNINREPNAEDAWHTLLNPTATFALNQDTTRAAKKDTTEKFSKVSVRLRTDNKEPILNEVLVSLREFKSKKIVGESKFIGDNFEFTHQPGEYEIIIEVRGYRTEKQLLQLEPEQTKSLEIIMKASGLPLFLQRLLR